jgi:F-type H+-transporting ATPase subunit b
MVWPSLAVRKFTPVFLVVSLVMLGFLGWGGGGHVSAAPWQEDEAAPAGAVEDPAPADSDQDDHDDHGAGDHGHGAHGQDSHGAHGHDDHHDPFDLSEANPSPMLATPADLRFDMAIYTVVVFLLLFAGLYKFAWGPICGALEKRERGIAEQIEAANQAAIAAAEKLRDYEARLSKASEEARAIIQQAHQDAQRSSERMIAEAQERAERERVRSVADIEAAKNVALESISQKTVELAMSLAGRIVRKELSESDHTQLIREALEKMPSRN